MDAVTSHALGGFLMLFGFMMLIFIIVPFYLKRWRWAKEQMEQEFTPDELEKLNLEFRSKFAKRIQSIFNRSDNK